MINPERGVNAAESRFRKLDDGENMSYFFANAAE
jgi:hypothetical protein